MTPIKRRQVLNHCDRISFAGCIYVFKYPKLRRALKRLIDESINMNEEGEETKNLTKTEQEELAWTFI